MSSLKVWPVIHVLDPDIALSNAILAQEEGCEGVFLIQMDGKDELLIPVYRQIRLHCNRLKVGFNFLSKSPLMALKESLDWGADATWTDTPKVNSQTIEQEAKEIGSVLALIPEHLFFGSVAFKYQPSESNPRKAAEQAASLGMIPTTSGSKTGVAPDVSKLKEMQEGGRLTLALASGATPENIQSLRPYLDYVLVSTGISSSFYWFDKNKLKEFCSQTA